MIDLTLKSIAELAKDEFGENAGIVVSANDVLQLIDQLEAAQKYAARYQWVRSTYSDDGIEFWPDAVSFADTAEKLDAAIDAAMQSTN